MRRDSLNNKLADWIDVLVKVVAEDWTDDVATIDRMRLTDIAAPNYDGDLEADTGLPAGPERFADALDRADAVIISCPEYNASMPGTFKNVIDWVSRLRPQPFAGQRGLLTSASPSLVGGNRGLWSLRVPLEQLGMHVYPDMYSLAQAAEHLDDDNFLNSSIGQRLYLLVRDFLDEARHLANNGTKHD